jgi:ribosomal protein L10
MKREDKNVIIQELTEKLNKYDHFYLTDISNSMLKIQVC